MHKVQNNLGRSKHINNECVEEQKERQGEIKLSQN
jgi:hypothetical protein